MSLLAKVLTGVSIQWSLAQLAGSIFQLVAGPLTAKPRAFASFVQREHLIIGARGSKLSSSRRSDQDLYKLHRPGNDYCHLAH